MLSNDDVIRLKQHAVLYNDSLFSQNTENQSMEMVQNQAEVFPVTAQTRYVEPGWKLYSVSVCAQAVAAVELGDCAACEWQYKLFAVLTDSTNTLPLHAHCFN